MIKIALCDDNEIERGILKNVVEGLLLDIVLRYLSFLQARNFLEITQEEIMMLFF